MRLHVNTFLRFFNFYFKMERMDKGDERIRNIKPPLCVLTGTVVEGEKRGRAVGMPTANMAPHEDISGLAPGVYASAVSFDGKAYHGITHIGKRPSVDASGRITVETHIFDFNSDIYGKELRLSLYKFIRPTIHFTSLKEVKTQVDADTAQVKAFFGI